MPMAVSNARPGSVPGMSRWEILCALQSLLPSLKTAEARLDRAQMAYWLEQADAELANITRDRPSEATTIPALIASCPEGRISACNGIGGYHA